MDIISLIASFVSLGVTVYLALYFHRIKIDRVHLNTIKILRSLERRTDVLSIDVLRMISDMIDERNVSLITDVVWDMIEKKDVGDADQLLAIYYNTTESSYQRISDFKVPWDDTLPVKNFFLKFNQRDNEMAVRDFYNSYQKGRFKRKDDVKSFILNKANKMSEKFNKFVQNLE